MAYKKDQGRYARMSAFWAIFLLLAFGCLGGAGLTTALRGWFPSFGVAWMDPQPLIGVIDPAKLAAIGVLVAAGITLHRILNRPKLADLLIETEGELAKVTWPTPGEAWTGTVAVIVTVIVLACYLFASDLFFAWVMPPLMGVRL